MLEIQEKSKVRVVGGTKILASGKYLIKNTRINIPSQAMSAVPAAMWASLRGRALSYFVFRSSNDLINCKHNICVAFYPSVEFDYEFAWLELQRENVWICLFIAQQISRIANGSWKQKGLFECSPFYATIATSCCNIIHTIRRNNLQSTVLVL